MSMISAQIDELRELADDIESRYGYPTAVKALRYAADTIWQLRDDLQRANAENAKLREELADAPKCETCEAMLDCDECLRADVSHKERRRPEAENDRLRELAAILCHCMQIKASCDDCCISGHKGELARDPLCACDGLHDMLGELGVEVDGWTSTTVCESCLCRRTTHLLRGSR